MKYTSGPWEVRKHVHVQSHTIYACNSVSGAIASVRNRFDEENQIANAVLIAKAPEMLKVLEKLVRLSEVTPSMPISNFVDNYSNVRNLVL